jgi:hypothetical protein
LAAGLPPPPRPFFFFFFAVACVLCGGCAQTAEELSELFSSASSRRHLLVHRMFDWSMVRLFGGGRRDRRQH